MKIDPSKAPKPFKPKVPKPKPKGKGAKGIKAKPDIKGLDVFKVILEGDAGGDSSSKNAIKDYMHNLTKPELNELERLIEKVRKNTLKSKEQTMAADEFSGALEDRVRIAAEKEEKIRRRVVEKWKTLKEEKECRVTLPDERVLGKNLDMGIRNFIAKYFDKELKEIEALMKEGLLIRLRKGARGIGLVKTWIQNI